MLTKEFHGCSVPLLAVHPNRETIHESCLLFDDLLLVEYTVASPHQLDADPDPIFTLVRIWIKLFLWSGSGYGFCGSWKWCESWSLQNKLFGWMGSRNPEAQFIVPDWGEKVDYGVRSSAYLPARLHWRAGMTTLSIVDFIPSQGLGRGTMESATTCIIDIFLLTHHCSPSRLYTPDRSCAKNFYEI